MTGVTGVTGVANTLADFAQWWKGLQVQIEIHQPDFEAHLVRLEEVPDMRLGEGPREMPAPGRNEEGNEGQQYRLKHTCA